MRSTANYLPAGERREATIEAVIDLASQSNPGDITTSAIAAKMGLTQGALFRHFPTKDSIIEAVVEWVVERLMTRVHAAVATSSSPLAALEQVFMAHLAFVVAHPGVPRIIFGQLQHAEQTAAKRAVLAMLRQYSQLIAKLLADGQQTGEVDPKLDINAASTLFVGTIQGLVMQSLIHGDLGRISADSPRVFRVYRRGIECAQ